MYLCIHSFCTKDLTKKKQEDSAIGAGAAESFLLVIPCHVFPCFEMKDADIDLDTPPTARPLRCRSVLLRAVFIADSHQVDQIAHGGLFNYTLLSVRPSIAQLMQSFMRLFRSIPSGEMQPGPNPPTPYPHPSCPPRGVIVPRH